jgi:hypothetical protein
MEHSNHITIVLLSSVLFSCAERKNLSTKIHRRESTANLFFSFFLCGLGEYVLEDYLSQDGEHISFIV